MLDGIEEAISDGFEDISAIPARLAREAAKRRHDCTGMATLIAVATGITSLACLAVLAFALAVAVAGVL